VRFAFVGLGHAAQWLHVPAVRALPGATIVAGADPSPEPRAQWATLDAGPTYPDLDELLAHHAVDVVVIGTPPASHFELCMKSLGAGAHVVCEKPFVETIEQADEIIATASGAGRHVALNQEFRYMPIFSAIAREIGRADVGRPVFLQVTQLMDLPPWEEKVAWRAAMPNRTLFEGGVHLVDLIATYLGRLPVSVHAITSSGLDEQRQADAIHLVTMDFGQGLLAQVTINRLCPSGTRYVDLRLDCERASLRASFGGRAFVQVGIKRAQRPGIRVEYGPEGLAWAERGLRRATLARNPRAATAHATAALYRDVAQAFARGVEPPVNARQARDVLRIIEAAYRSAETGEPVGLRD
jgi:predicted dehydrogenase